MARSFASAIELMDGARVALVQLGPLTLHNPNRHRRDPDLRMWAGQQRALDQPASQS
jgi:hypothetical protein